MRRTKYTDIPIRVKKKVWDRDGGMCIICGRPGTPSCHYISRAQNGMGVEENIVTLCWEHHYQYDNERRNELKPCIEYYLRSIYKKWDPEKIVYHKWPQQSGTDASGNDGKTG